jgi:hypothetical protein
MRRGKYLTRQKKIIIFSIISVSIVSIGLIVALQSNWFNLGNLTGTVKQPGPITVVQSQLVLGNIDPLSHFESTDTATMTIPANPQGGYNVTKFCIGAPGTSMGTYLLARFENFSLNLTIDSLSVITYEYVLNGVCTYNYGPYDETQDGYVWLRFPTWDNVFLNTGTHSIIITVFGDSTIPFEDLTIDMRFIFELGI